MRQAKTTQNAKCMHKDRKEGGVAKLMGEKDERDEIERRSPLIAG
jgi:hypothetical protein